MPRSKFVGAACSRPRAAAGRPYSRPVAVALVVFALASSASAAEPVKPYHLELEAQPAAVFPYLAKFGKVDLDVYPSGVRADTIWLNGFSRNGAQTITVENPLGRMYTEVPISQITATLHRLGSFGSVELAAVPASVKSSRGKVRGIDAIRHRLEFGPDAYVDYWTTSVVPENPQFRRIVNEVVSAISPGTGQIASKIPGTPIYVELNFRRFKKVPLVRLKKLSRDVAGEGDALTVGSFYFKAPLLDALWR